MAVTFSAISEPLTTVFTFRASPAPLPVYSFTKNAHRRCPKRSRPVADVDTLVSGSKKKRRLRLSLITSRLSRPFSTPATHIADRGSSKIAVWAKQRHLAPQALRKAAIMNRVRRQTLERRDPRKDSGISVGEDARREARQAVYEGLNAQNHAATGFNPNAALAPDDAHHSILPSPLGLSNYDALDAEDADWYEIYEEEGGEEEEISNSTRKPPGHRIEQRRNTDQLETYYSDFNFFEHHSPKDDEADDDPFHLGLLPLDIAKEKRPPSPPEDKMAELLKELQREREITSEFLYFA